MRIVAWDVPVRLFHGALAVLAVFSFTTGHVGGEWLAWHMRSGYCILALVAFRIAWGLVGSETARFSAFLRGPGAALRYGRETFARRHPAVLGHNPLGGWMVLALFSCVAGLAATGWLYSTDEFWGDRTVERIHIDFAWAIVALAALHVAGVIVTGLVQRENLVAAMLHGSKRDPAEGDVI